jgi:hypothetical protein
MSSTAATKISATLISLIFSIMRKVKVAA